MNNERGKEEERGTAAGEENSVRERAERRPPIE